MREKIALALLAVLVIVAAAAMGWYLLVGHNWNVAASTIDDRIGELDGYTVLLYEGRTLPETERMRLSNSQPMLDDGNRGAVRASADSLEQAAPVDIAQAASSYRQKGATVFVLHPELLSEYYEPEIITKNGKWLGVFGVDGRATRFASKAKADALDQRGASLVIAYADDARLIDAPVDSIDILISTLDEELPEGGRNAGSTFCVDSPVVGQVQAIIISPSNVLISKTITSL